MGEFFDFERMLTPTLVRILFILGVIGLVIAGLLIMSSGEGFAGVATGIGIIIFGSLYLRVLSEMLVVVFVMNETLTDIRNNTRPR